MKTGPTISLHALVILIGVFSCFRPTILSGFERMQSDDGDTVLNNYLLEHTWLWLSDRSYPFGFWSPGFFYPTADVLTYSENMIGAAPIYWGLRLAFDETVSFQLWHMLLFALNYAALAWVLHRWQTPMIWVIGLSYVFAFGLMRSSQIFHQQMHAQYYSVLAIYQLRQFLSIPSIGRCFRLGIFVSAQCLACIYLGWFLIYGIGISLAMIALLNHGSLLPSLRFIRKNRLSISLTTMIWLLPMMAFFAHYVRGNDTPRGYAETCTFMPDIRCCLVGSKASLWDYDWGIAEAQLLVESRQSNGLILYVLYVLAWFSTARMETGEAKTWIRCSLATCVISIISVVDFGDGNSIWRLIYHALPGANALRAIGRIALMAHLFGVVAIALSAKGFAEIGLGMRWQYLLLALLIGEQIVWKYDSFPKSETYGVARSMADVCSDGDLLYVDSPTEIDSAGNQALAMWVGLYARKPVVNGYSGRRPPEYPLDFPPTDRQLLEFAKPGATTRFIRIRIANNAIEVRKLQGLHED